jgi:hypothetical protein
LFQTLYTPEPAGLLAILTSLEWHVLFTLGGTLLAMIWPALWPLPALTLLSSLTAAALAAARVDLPSWQRRIWSRPLVTALYLLQPIARGWPRYAHRLRRSETPTTAHAAVREMAKRYDSVSSIFTVNYWNEQGIERIAFLQKLLELLERDQWQATPDSGWDEHDVTIHGDRFTKAVVNTVCENHGGDKRLLRARLCARWTLLAKVLLWAVVALVALFLVVTSHALWALSAWLLVAIAAGFLHLRAKRTLRLGIALLDVTAQQMGFTRLNAPRKFAKPE